MCIYIYPWSWRLEHSYQQTSTMAGSGVLGTSIFVFLSWPASVPHICGAWARFWGILGCLGLWFQGLLPGKLFVGQVMFRLDETRLFEVLDGPLPWPFGHICSGSNFFDTFGRFFVIMFANVSKPIPVPRDSRSLKSTKIQLRLFSAALESPWPPKGTKWAYLGALAAHSGSLWSHFEVFFQCTLKF